MKPQQFILVLGAIAMTALPPALPASAETTAQLDSFAIPQSEMPIAQPDQSADDDRTSGESPACYEILQRDLTSHPAVDAQVTPANDLGFQQALIEAAKFYRMHVLSKVIGGQPKYLVVMTPGRHSDNAEAADQALKNFIGSFETVGVTGHGSTVGSIVSEKIAKRWRRKSKIKPPPKRFQLARRLARRLIARFYGSYSQIHDPGVLQMYDYAKGQTDDPAAAAVAQKTVALDANYTPSNLEHLDSIGSTVTWGLAFLMIGLSSHIPHSCTFGAEWLITVTSTYRFAMRFSLTAPNLKLNPWYRRIFPLGVGFIRGKSSVIANNIQASLTNAKSMVAVVPQNHIDEVLSLLENEGYEQRN